MKTQGSGFHNKASKKYVRELEYDDNVLFEHHKDGFWAVFADKDYHDGADSFRIKHRIWAPNHAARTASQQKSNPKASPDCINF